MESITLPDADKSHHASSTSFQNPWPSFASHGLLDLLHTRFRSDRNFVPVPSSRDELVQVQRPTFGHDTPAAASNLKATWLGHASWFIEFPRLQSKDSAQAPAQEPAQEPAQVSSTISHSNTNTSNSKSRGVSLLLDPVFADRTSPLRFLGPKRYSPLPCTLNDLPPVDAVLISHNHYDHLDVDAVRALHKRDRGTLFFVPLRNREWFVSAGIPADLVIELDWWHAASLDVPGFGCLSIVCTPAQHTSARTPFDRDATLWSSWAVGTGRSAPSTTTVSFAQDTTPIRNATLLEREIPFTAPRLFFAGDTGYRSVHSAHPTAEELAAAPRCPAFAQLGSLLGPFDLALLPIGLYSPRDMLSGVHCAPEDAVCVHVDVRAKRSVGMHYGTFRGGLSAQYEDVREPPRRFERAAKEAGLDWGGEIGLCAIGETVVV